MTAIGVKQNRSLNVCHRVCSEVHLETTGGLLVGRTSTWSTVLWSSVQSAAQALVLDANGDVLVAGLLSAYDANSTVGHHERSDVFALVGAIPPRHTRQTDRDHPQLESAVARRSRVGSARPRDGSLLCWPTRRWATSRPVQRCAGPMTSFRGHAGPEDSQALRTISRNPTDLHRAVDSGAPAHELFRDVELVGAADRHA